MAIPLLPAPLDARFDADGFHCVLRTRDVLLPPGLLASVSVLTIASAVVLSALIGARLAHDFAGWMVLCCVAAALLVGGRALLDLLIGAPRTVRLRCTHELLDVDVRLLGLPCRRARLPLASIERCRTTSEGLEIRHLVDGWSRRTALALFHTGPEIERIAAEIERAAERRRRFEAATSAPEAQRARALLDLLLDQSDSGKRKRLTAGR